MHSDILPKIAHADFTMGLIWSFEFAALTNRKLGLKVTYVPHIVVDR